MTSEDAKTLLGFLSVIVIPFAVTWLKAVTWPSWQKFGLAVLLSGITGFLTAYSNQQILLSGSFVQNSAVIFTASQLVYYGAFRALGLERVLFPQSALAHKAEEQATKEVSTVSRETAQAILDPSVPQTLDVTANVVLTDPDTQKEV